jgi:hypothetical protein
LKGILKGLKGILRLCLNWNLLLSRFSVERTEFCLKMSWWLLSGIYRSCVDFTWVTTVYDDIRPLTLGFTVVPVKIPPYYARFFGVYGTVFAVYDTALYGRNTLHMKWVIYMRYTVVIITFVIVYVNVNGCLLSYTVVVMFGMGLLRSNWV